MLNNAKILSNAAFDLHMTSKGLLAIFVCMADTTTEDMLRRLRAGASAAFKNKNTLYFT